MEKGLEIEAGSASCSPRDCWSLWEEGGGRRGREGEAGERGHLRMLLGFSSSSARAGSELAAAGTRGGPRQAGPVRAWSQDLLSSEGDA